MSEFLGWNLSIFISVQHLKYTYQVLFLENNGIFETAGNKLRIVDFPIVICVNVFNEIFDLSQTHMILLFLKGSF